MLKIFLVLLGVLIGILLAKCLMTKKLPCPACIGGNPQGRPCPPCPPPLPSRCLVW